MDASEESQIEAAMAASMLPNASHKKRGLNKHMAATALSLLDSDDDSESTDNLETFSDSEVETEPATSCNKVNGNLIFPTTLSSTSRVQNGCFGQASSVDPVNEQKSSGTLHALNTETEQSTGAAPNTEVSHNTEKCQETTCENWTDFLGADQGE